MRRKCRTHNIRLQTPYPGSHDRRLYVSSECSNSDLDRNKSSNSTTFQTILAPIYLFQLPGHDWLPLSSMHNSTLRWGRTCPCNIHHSSTTPTRQLAVINVCLPPVKKTQSTSAAMNANHLHHASSSQSTNARDPNAGFKALLVLPPQPKWRLCMMPINCSITWGALTGYPWLG
jgi:hypothetical protein